MKQIQKNHPPQRDQVLIKELLGETGEHSTVEFKHNNSNEQMIGKLVSALSNAARLEDKANAYIIWGVADETKALVGTDFDPLTERVGNQELQIWLVSRLQPRIHFTFRKVTVDEVGLVLLEIPPAPNAPVEFDRIAYIRLGSATPRLADYQEHQAALWRKIQSFAWESGIAKQFITGDEVLDLLDYSSYFRFTRQPLPDNRVGIFERLLADQLIQKDVGEYWNITNLGAILFATDLSAVASAIARKAVRFIAYNGKNRADTVTHRHDDVKGYASGFSGLVGFINGLLPKNEQIGQVFREERPLYPEIAIRELVANAIIHQDMTITGAGPQIELFKDRLEITNPGKPLVEPERFLDLPPRSRNEMLASLMRRMGFCEEQGSGIDKVLISIELHQMPAPDFRKENDTVRVVLFAPRKFADMSPAERIRACYQHAALKYLEGERMKNASLCERLGIDAKNAAQASQVISKALEAGLIKFADSEHPRAGYFPFWA